MIHDANQVAHDEDGAEVAAEKDATIWKRKRRGERKTGQRRLRVLWENEKGKKIFYAEQR